LTGIVIVGAGQAGFSVASRLRGEGYAGPLVLIGDEADPPYQRPPLSKKYLMGELPRERLYFRAETYYRDNGIDLRLGAAAHAIDRKHRVLECESGAVPYETLVLATGASPRRLPAATGGALAGVHAVRTLADIDAMTPEFKPGAKLLIVGGGYIGLETAAVAVSAGLETTIVEASPRILQRVAAAETAAFLRRVHADRGVCIREGAGLSRLIGGDRVEAAELDTGERLPVDLAVVGIGVVPNMRLAVEAGLLVEDGVRVDAQGRTSDPSIFAAGDCASFSHQGRLIRLESVPHAIEQANVVADAILGAARTYAPKPWFWSDQYDLKLQIAGLNTGYDRVVPRPGAREQAMSFWYFRDGRLLAVDAVSDPQAYMTGKRWIESDLSPAPDDLADAAKGLKQVVAR
jgi:3-phenylpropionate/trans-cinnamate dioxygenase ferredoxin reductase subunit